MIGVALVVCVPYRFFVTLWWLPPPKQLGATVIPWSTRLEIVRCFRDRLWGAIGFIPNREANRHSSGYRGLLDLWSSRFIHKCSCCSQPWVVVVLIIEERWSLDSLQYLRRWPASHWTMGIYLVWSSLCGLSTLHLCFTFVLFNPWCRKSRTCLPRVFALLVVSLF